MLKWGNGWKPGQIKKFEWVSSLCYPPLNYFGHKDLFCREFCAREDQIYLNKRGIRRLQNRYH